MIWVSYQIGCQLDEPCGFSGDHWQMQQCFNVGLNLFNDDTRPSGHISRPTPVNVPQGLLSFSKKPSYTGKCVSYQIEESRFSQEFHYASLMQELSWREHSTSRLCMISSRHSCNNAHSSSILWSMVSVWPQWSNQSAVLGTRYGIWWPWYGQFEVGWLQPLPQWCHSFGFTR